MIRELNFEKCNGCPYYFEEIDQCMFGDDDIPNDMEKKCKDQKRIGGSVND